MTLIKSISGIRGTVGGRPGENLTPLDIVKFVSAYATWLKEGAGKQKAKIVLGRDARVSGDMYAKLVEATLSALGHDVVNIGLATTPTTEIAVTAEKADGGIILTASHNPKQWNALKLLNADGEFLSAEEGNKVLEMADKESFEYADVDELGMITYKDYTNYHIQHVLDLKLVNREAIAGANLKVVVDAVNSVGGVVIPALLKALGVKEIIPLNCEPTGLFSHNPEPIPENLTQISEKIKACGADLGIVVDPDVDRLALVCENGEMFVEEYTLVAVADFVLKHTPGNTVSNLSSSRALRDVTVGYGQSYNAAAVGEVNVVAKMKETQTVIGGEGNGGVIYPESHYGRDALVGVGLFLSHYVAEGKKMTELKATYPQYFISKNKLTLSPGMDVDKILAGLKQKYASEEITDIDGVKIDFAEGWVHLRKSNTEPIIRIYSEAKDEDSANRLAEEVIQVARGLIG
ncbi:phosphoglucosamine mutase [uncultured Sanguibacteroides sp.]|uniref:phosphoglucosamine mutase n=1 Tax=uncultured Sanguibacteroides sp. TaxID=1635151 RepID=UPI0025E50A01|nr:phosphoglucosamine mutase [uncultured Sanguibacteroides sp.]